jgi:predicted permease
MLPQIFAIVAPVLVIAFIGYVWDRRRLPFDTNMVSDLVTNVGSPCLLFSTLLGSRPDPAVLGQMVLAGVILVTAVGAVAAIVLRVAGQPARVYWPAMTFPNAGNMGLPLCLFAFGETGLALAVAFFATMSFLQFTVGVGVASGRVTLQGLLRSPVLWAIAAAAIFLWTDAALPEWLANTTELISGLVIPLMLMSLGASLARLKVAAFGRSFAFAMFRLVLGFGVAVSLCEIFALEGAVRGVVIIQSAMPTAVFCYLFAMRYGNRPEEVGSMVVISTVVSFLSLPLLLAFVLAA